MENLKQLDISIFVPGMEFTWESLEKDSLGGCITGDTFIDTPRNLKEYPEGISIKTLCEEYANGVKDKMVYAYDSKQKQIVLRKILKVWKTQINAEIWKVSYQWKDKNEKIKIGSLKATPEHKIMLRDGSYKELKDLQPGESLMPFNRFQGKRKDSKYYRIDLNNSLWEYEHHFIPNELGIQYSPKRGVIGDVMHHKNFCWYDNSPNNLQVMDWKNHLSLHKGSNQSFRNWYDNLSEEEYKEFCVKQKNLSKSFWDNITEDQRKSYSTNCTKQNKKWWATSTKEQKDLRCFNISKSIKEFHKNNPEKSLEMCRKGGKIVGGWNKGKKMSKEQRQQLSDIKKKYFENAENRTKHALKLKEIMSNPDIRKNLSEKALINHNNPKFKKHFKDFHTELNKKYWNNLSNEEQKLKMEHMRSARKNKSLEMTNHAVISVTKLDYKEDVYDMEVEDVHNFAANGIIIHNSESAALSLAKSLAKLGHRVYVFGKIKDLGFKPDGVCYFPAEQFTSFACMNPHDVTIVERTPELFGMKTNSKLNILHQHDLAMLRSADVFKSTLWNVDKVFVVSDYMKEQYKEVYGIKDDIVYATRNGLDLDLFKDKPSTKRNKKRIVYASRPERGLDMLFENIMPKLWEKDPDIELALCGYSFTTEAMKPFYDYLQTFVNKHQDKVKWHGALTKKQLYDLLKTSRVYVYPTPSHRMEYFAEVYSIIVAEAQACGLPVVSTHEGALPQTLHPDAGVLLKGRPWEEEYINQFVDATLNYINNDIDFEKSSKAGKAHALTLSWDAVALDWTEQFTKLIDKNNDNDVRLIRHLIKHSDIIPATKLLERMNPDEAKPYKEWIDTTWNLGNGVAWYGENKIDNLPANPMEHAGCQTRIQAVSQFLKEQKDVKNVIDYGSADGGCVQYYTKELTDKNFVGVDINGNSVRYANSFIEKYELDPERIQFIEANENTDVITEYVKRKGMFDCITCTDVLEHQPDPSTFIDKLETYIKDDGIVVITVPYGPWEYGSFHLPPPREHLWHFDFHDIYDMFKDKKSLNIQTIPANISPETGDPLGYYFITYVKNNTKTGIIDVDRHLRLQRPRQTVSASIIAGANCEETLHWCLRSISGIVDEIIIANCGMNEEALRIASMYSVKIVEGANPLEVGFGNARNIGLEHCTMDWVAWIDTDEKLLQPEKLNKYLRENLFNGYSIRQHHFAVDTVFKPDLPVRLFRNREVDGKRIKFYNFVHEHPETGLNEGPGLSIVLSDVHIAHVGYLIESGRKTRFWRNRPLLEKGNQECPDRILNKYFTMRDNMLLCTYELQQNGGLISDNIQRLSKETIELFREHFLGKGNYLNGDALDYYSQACRFLGLGAEVTFAINASKTEIPQADVKSYRFATEDDLQKEMQWRIKENMANLTSKWY